MPIQVFVGLAVPKGTPRPIIDKINKVINEGLRNREDFKKAIELLKLVVAPENTPEEFGEIMKAEAERWKEVVPTAGLQKQ
jgi:tripartite-type tricarboxylate transporter receptor subunit TctC